MDPRENAAYIEQLSALDPSSVLQKLHPFAGFSKPADKNGPKASKLPKMKTPPRPRKPRKRKQRTENRFVLRLMLFVCFLVLFFYLCTVWYTRTVLFVFSGVVKRGRGGIRGRRRTEPFFRRTLGEPLPGNRGMTFSQIVVMLFFSYNNMIIN